MGRLGPDEHAPVQRRRRPAVPQVGGYCPASVRRKGKPVAAVPLAGDSDLAPAIVISPPVDITQPQPGDLASAHAHPRQQRQNRQVTPAGPLTSQDVRRAST